MKSKLLTGICVLLLSLTLSAQEDLNSYLELAAENNPGLQAKFDEYMASLELISQSNAMPDPKVAFGYFIKPVETRVGPQQFKFSASQMFPWFGTLKAKENVATQSAKAKYEMFEEVKSDLFNQVRAIYFNLYLNNKSIDITQDNLEILGTFRQLAIIKIEADLVSPVDEYRLEMEINDLENQLALLKDKQQVLEVSFKNLLNVDDVEIKLPDDLWIDDIELTKEAALDSVKTTNHQLLSLEIQQTALEYQKEVAQKQGNPEINLGFEYAVIGKGDNNSAGTDAFVFPTVGISIPLYRNKYKAMVDEVAYRQSAKSKETENKANMLETLFENGWKDYRDADRRIDLFQRQEELANQSISLLETAYTTGSKDFEEVLRMERKVLQYSLEFEKAKTDKQAAISFINYLMGK